MNVQTKPARFDSSAETAAVQAWLGYPLALTTTDWIVATAVSASLLAGMELAKFFLRRFRPVPA